MLRHSLALAFVAAVLSGCLAKPNRPPAVFTLSGPPAAAEKASEALPVLGLKAVTISPLFESKSFVYRLDETRYERDAYAEFMVAPERMLAASVQAHLRQSGLFHEVTAGGGMLKPSQWLEMDVREIYGDFRQSQSPSAVLAIKFTFYEPGRESFYRTVLEKTYRRQAPVSGIGPSALAAAWNQALQQMMQEVVSDLKGSGPAQSR